MNTVFRTMMLSGLIWCGAQTLPAQRAIFVEETYADTDFNLVNSELPSWDIIPGGEQRRHTCADESPVCHWQKR
ncbi:MAG: hypothetical protein R2795_10955 [Saprospiraceae bacterium]